MTHKVRNSESLCHHPLSHVCGHLAIPLGFLLDGWKIAAERSCPEADALGSDYEKQSEKCAWYLGALGPGFFPVTVRSRLFPARIRPSYSSPRLSRTSQAGTFRQGITAPSLEKSEFQTTGVSLGL